MAFVLMCAACHAEWKGADTKHSPVCANVRNSWEYTVERDSKDLIFYPERRK